MIWIILASTLINSHRVLSTILWQSDYLFYEDRHVVDTSSCWMDGQLFRVTLNWACTVKKLHLHD
jgi:hypothetical protein